MMMDFLFFLFFYFILFFFQVKEASTAIQKTSQQVQKLVQMVSKPSPGAPLLRSPTQPPSQSGEHVCFPLVNIIPLSEYFIFETKVVCALSTIQVFRVQCRQCLYPKSHHSLWPSQTQTWKKMSSESGWTFWERNAPRPGTEAPWLLSVLSVCYQIIQSSFRLSILCILCLIFPDLLSHPLSIFRKRCIQV